MSPAAIIVDGGAVANPGAGGAAVPAGTGSTFTVRGVNAQSVTQLVGLVRSGATKGNVMLKSPYLQGPTDGIRYAVPAADVDNLIADGPFQSLTPQDTLQISVTGGAAESDGAMIQTYYQDLPGSNMILKSPGDINGQAQYVTTWEVALTSGAAAGNWGDVLINSLYDDSLGNRYYAILGFVLDTKVMGISVWGPDTSNFRIGGPGVADPYKTRAYFQQLSNRLGVPAIPCFSTTNKGATSVGAIDTGAATTTNCTLVVAIMPTTWTP